MKRANSFSFEKIDFVDRQIIFCYRIDGRLYTFSTWHQGDISLAGEPLLLVASQIGLAYMIDLMVVTMPREINIEVIKLKPGAIDFWKQSYKDALLERLYNEKLPTDIIENTTWSNQTTLLTIEPYRSIGEKVLMSMSGGKESLTMLDIFKKNKQEVNLFFLFYPISEKKGSLFFERKVFAELKQQYNSIQITTDIEDIGPIVREYGCEDNSVFVIAQLVFNTLLYSPEYRYLLIGNEYSSNFGNALYNGENVNHQHDKTVDFARRINSYLHKYVTPDFTYGSPFFGYYELEIGKMFAKKNDNFEIWTSCNSTIEGKNFCCDCPKCAFTFSILRPFTTRAFLLNYFEKNMLDRLDLFLPLIDPEAEKPLDCVGVKEEVWYALFLLMNTEEKSTEVISYFARAIYPKIQNSLPEIGKELIKKQTTENFLPFSIESMVDTYFLN